MLKIRKKYLVLLLLLFFASAAVVVAPITHHHIISPSFTIRMVQGEDYIYKQLDKKVVPERNELKYYYHEYLKETSQLPRYNKHPFYDHPMVQVWKKIIDQLVLQKKEISFFDHLEEKGILIEKCMKKDSFDDDQQEEYYDIQDLQNNLLHVSIKFSEFILHHVHLLREKIGSYTHSVYNMSVKLSQSVVNKMTSLHHFIKKLNIATRYVIMNEALLTTTVTKVKSDKENLISFIKPEENVIPSITLNIIDTERFQTKELRQQGDQKITKLANIDGELVMMVQFTFTEVKRVLDRIFELVSLICLDPIDFILKDMVKDIDRCLRYSHTMESGPVQDLLQNVLVAIKSWFDIPIFGIKILGLVVKITDDMLFIHCLMSAVIILDILFYLTILLYYMFSFDINII